MLNKMLIIGMLALFVFGFASCESNGPGDKIGKKIDQAIQNANDKSK